MGVTWRLLGACSVSLLGCSLLVQSSAVQCTTDQDCLARGFDAGGPMTCSPDHVCVGPGGPCTTNQECIQRSGGQPAVCRKSDLTCVPLLSNECLKVYGDPSSDDAIVIGSIFTLKGVNQSSGTARTQSIELAADDFTQTVVGLPGGSGGKPRPLVLVECDDSSDNTTAQNAAAHLVEVGVPAIIGPGGSGLVTAVVQNVTIPAGVFLITPSATSTSLSGLNELVWRTAPSDEIQAIAMRDQVGAIESTFKTANPTFTKVKLAVAYQNNTYGTGLFTNVTTGLQLNGALVSDPANSGYFTPLQYDATALDPSSAAAQVVTDADNLLVGIGTTEIITKFLTPVETNWSGSTPRPLYLFSDAGEKAELLTAVTGNDALRARVRGTVPGTSNPLFGTFTIQYQGKYGSAPTAFGTAGAYDSLYLVAYALVSLGTQPVTGTAIAGAMAKMVGGQSVDVGAAHIKSAFQILQSGNAIDINGASGPLDFDLAKHEAPSDITVWCISKDGSGNPIFAPSGRFYDASKSQMSGTFACP
jgi:ABC-type branched-subunit amino acid transport system substrate-binding protein